MDEYSDLDAEESSSDAEEEQALEEPTGDTVSRKAYERAISQLKKAQAKVRRAELAEAYGSKIAGLVPDELPTEKWSEFAEKLKAEFPSSPTPTDEGTESPAPVAAEQPTEQERKAAALANSGSGAAVPSVITDVQEAVAIAAADPDRYRQLKAAGVINLERLPGSKT